MRRKALITASLFVAALALVACTGSVKSVKFDNSLSQKLGGDPVTLTGKLIKPAGEGPFPAVVILHPCVGLTPNQDRWASRFKSWGYVSFLVNSFGPRGVSDDCGKPPFKVPFDLRAQDAYDAKSYLATLPFVDASRIAVAGWSHGAGSTIEVVTLDFNYPRERLFRAAVAFYPYCRKWLGAVNAPLLIQAGELDDWCPAQKCIDNTPKKTKTGHEVALKVYPGAHHCFDIQGLDRTSHGHRLKYNRQAAVDAQVQVKDFLTKYLQ
jgi:dienelactone hydrolase